MNVLSKAANAVNLSFIFRMILLGLVASSVQSKADVRKSELGQPLFDSGFADAVPKQDAMPFMGPSFFDHGDPTDFEQLMLELVNRARANPGAEAARLGIDLNEGLAPDTIADTPKPPLSLHPLLIQAARDHSLWMLDNNIFSHTGEGDSSPYERIEAAGYVFSGMWAVGENIAWGGTTGTLMVEQETRSLHDGLFLSPGHRTNICGEGFDEIGLGLLTGVFTTAAIDYNALMVTQKYALSADTPGPRLLGVVYSDANTNGLYDIGEGLGGIHVSIVDGEWQTATSSSGGYAVPYSGHSGFLTVVLSGAPLPSPVQLSIPRTGSNIKVDVELDSLMTLLITDTSSGEGPVSVTAQGVEYLLFDLQYSTNLMTWTTISTQAFGPDPIALQHEPTDPSPAHFYRLRWAE